MTWRLCLALLSALWLSPAWALSQEPAKSLDYGLFEEVVRVAGKGPQATTLEVTVFRPRDAGPFPLVILNHGRSAGPAKSQPRYRPLHVAYEFVRRGYAVVVPMREGFAGSDGVEQDGSCDVAANARRQAESIQTAAQWAGLQSWADASRVVVMGPSHGGLATLAYGQLAPVGTRLLINVAGGLRLAHCEAWQEDLVAAMGALGAGARALPSLWIYGDNDSHFSPAIWRTAYQRYVALGGQAELLEVGSFGDDAHLLLASPKGVSRWLPPVLRQMEARGLPTAIQTRYDALLDMPDTRLHLTALPEVAERLPVLGEPARRAFLRWLDAQTPKAFVVSHDGRHWTAVWGIAQPLGKALAHCQRESKKGCRLFAIDGFLVSGTD